jgi:hypothetical protein
MKEGRAMVSPESAGVARRGEEYYEKHLRTQMEKSHWGEFLVIDPESGEYFLGKRMEEATAKARALQGRPKGNNACYRVGPTPHLLSCDGRGETD